MQEKKICNCKIEVKLLIWLLEEDSRGYFVFYLLSRIKFQECLVGFSKALKFVQEYRKSSRKMRCLWDIKRDIYRNKKRKLMRSRE